MSRPRLDRRLVLLRGKRRGAFDRDQYYLERAERARVARRARVLLRRSEPVALVTPRWSHVERFLDDLAVDLLIGTPSVECRALSVAPLVGRTAYQAWSWLIEAFSAFGDLTIEEGPAALAVSRQGFRHVVAGLLARPDRGPRRCLMIHGLEHMPVDPLRDLISAFDEHVARNGPHPRFNLLLAGSIDGPHFEFAAGERLVLPDFGEEEAVLELVERLGAGDVPRLRALVAALGGVPALLDHAAGGGTSVPDADADRGELWKVLGPVATGVRDAFGIVAADDALLARMEDLAKTPELPEDPLRDGALMRAGLVRVRGSGPKTRKTSLRSPVFGDLAG